MSAPRLLTGLCLAAAFAAPITAQDVLINEFVYDDSSTDDREFVELFNSGTTTVDMSGWILELWDQTCETSKVAKKTYTIPANTRLAPGSFYVMGSAKVANVNQVIGTTDLFENSQEGLVLRDTAKKVIDSICYEMNKADQKNTWFKPFINGDGIWGNFASIDGRETSWSRVQDGYNNGTGRDWVLRPMTPGKSNNIVTVPVYLDNFDKGTPDTIHSGWGGSFIRPQYADPTKVSIANPNAIPASPQGGNCLTIWDPAGGGNMSMLLRRPLEDMVFEAYVYLDTTTPQAANYYEEWSIGVQGTTGTYYNIPDPANRFSATANGNTGVSVTYVVDATSATLFLIDHNDGGTDDTILGKITINKGKNDGWQRIRLEVTNNTAGLWVGGTMGQGNGEFVGGKIGTGALGDIYIGYREYNDPNSKNRPVTIDDVRIRPSSGAVSYYGTAAKTSTGPVMIAPAAPPVLGTQGFGVVGSGLAKSSAVVLTLGAGRTNIPLTPLFPANTSLYTQPIQLFGAASDANGEVSIPFPLPANLNFNGVKLSWQLFSFDPSLQVALPLAGSQGCETQFSQ